MAANVGKRPKKAPAKSLARSSNKSTNRSTNKSSTKKMPVRVSSSGKRDATRSSHDAGSRSSLDQGSRFSVDAESSSSSYSDKNVTRSNLVNTSTKGGSDDAANRVSQVFLVVFVIALSFVLGTGVGSRTGESIVDGAITEIIDSAPQPIDRVLLERAAIEGALRASGDEWANYFPTSTLDKLSQLTSNAISGAGISITRSRSGALEIVDIQRGSPAERSGMKVGDQILQVDGKNVQGQNTTSVAALIRGQSGKQVKIVIRRNTEVLAFALIAEQVDVRTVDATQVSDDIGYIEISSFAPQTPLELSESLKSLATNSGIIIDLRDNPGGSIESAVQVAELFIGRGVIVSYRVNGEERVLSANNPRPNNSPIVLLINRGTSSAAEILAAAFQDRNRGVVIGERSYGKGSVQDFVSLKDGSKLELTVGLYLTPAGRTIEGVGVTPDLDVQDDELSSKALQILGGLSQLTSPNGDSSKTKK